MGISFNATSGYMKVNDVSLQGGVKENEKVRPNEKTFCKHDTVMISPQAASFREVEQNTKAVAAEVNQSVSPEKINSLKAQISAGTYNVSAGDVADAILDRLAF